MRQGGQEPERPRRRRAGMRRRRCRRGGRRRSRHRPRRHSSRALGGGRARSSAPRPLGPEEMRWRQRRPRTPLRRRRSRIRVSGYATLRIPRQAIARHLRLPRWKARARKIKRESRAAIWTEREVEGRERGVHAEPSPSAAGRSLISPWTPSSASSRARWRLLTGQQIRVAPCRRKLDRRRARRAAAREPRHRRDRVSSSLRRNDRSWRLEPTDWKRRTSLRPANGSRNLAAARADRHGRPSATQRGRGRRVAGSGLSGRAGAGSQGALRQVGSEARAAARTGSQAATGPRGSAAGPTVFKWRTSSRPRHRRTSASIRATPSRSAS